MKKAMMRFRNMVPFMATIKEAWEKFCNSYPVETRGSSMHPAINVTPSFFLAERILDQYDKLSRGDVVHLRSPQDPKKTIIKRLVGMGGDNIKYVSVIKMKSIKNNSTPEYSYKHQTVVVPKGHAWVLGDNIYNSWDSREFGPVPYRLIEGKIYWRVSPDFGPFEKGEKK